MGTYPYFQSGDAHEYYYEYGYLSRESDYFVRHIYDSVNEYSVPYLPYIGLYKQKYPQIYATKLQNGIFYAYL